MSYGFNEMQWTREIDFGITVHCRRVNHVKATVLRHDTGNLVHAIDGAVLEWVVGAPKMKIRWLLVCGDMRRQDRAHVMTGKQQITCDKCRHRLAQREKK